MRAAKKTKQREPWKNGPCFRTYFASRAKTGGAQIVQKMFRCSAIKYVIMILRCPFLLFLSRRSYIVNVLFEFFGVLERKCLHAFEWSGFLTIPSLD